MSTIDPVLAARAALGVAARRKDPDAASLARQQLATAKVQRAIEEALRAAPPITTEQRAKLARLLRDGGGAK